MSTELRHAWSKCVEAERSPLGESGALPAEGTRARCPFTSADGSTYGRFSKGCQLKRLRRDSGMKKREAPERFRQSPMAPRGLTASCFLTGTVAAARSSQPPSIPERC